ncbi:MAG: diguanylate cyclase, partial [Terracidiphilus sp.]
VLSRHNAANDGNPDGLVTISIGCASAVPKPGQDATSLIQAADDLLYRAKRNGRDQLCSGLISVPFITPGI